MVMKKMFLIGLVALTFHLKGQTTADLINAVSLDSLVKSVREFSGEDSCSVYSNRVLIRNRVSISGNDLAADYLVQSINSTGLTAEQNDYASKGRNVWAKQIGSLYPDSIVMICSHYDAVADYCADDNASGTSIILEAARILSNYTFEKTIVYAFWDEEEIGLLGAKQYAQASFSDRDVYASVLNIDMAAYDSNNDKVFDIDLNSNAGSVRMKDKIISVNTNQSLDLVPVVVSPGTDASDHSAFWDYGYPAVLFGESWETGDQNSKYHSSQDRISLFNLPYYHEMAKLAIGYIGEEAGLMSSVGVDAVNDSGLKIQLLKGNLLNVIADESAILNVYNAAGAQVKSFSIVNQVSNFDMNSLVTGMYFVQSIGEWGVIETTPVLVR